ncbi:hypothetical protein L208DRAFT_1378221 [Tricholoma matsutake]|nr:hypothetical protein L208DRAFT_1378221 [Tricholoma matsutake 945]
MTAQRPQKILIQQRGFSASRVIALSPSKEVCRESNRQPTLEFGTVYSMFVQELAKLMLDSVHTRIRILHLHTSTYNSSIPEWALTYSSARDSPEEDDEGEEPRKEEPPMAVYSKKTFSSHAKTSSVARLDLQFSSLGLQSPPPELYGFSLALQGIHVEEVFRGLADHGRSFLRCHLLSTYLFNGSAWYAVKCRGFRLTEGDKPRNTSPQPEDPASTQSYILYIIVHVEYQGWIRT